MDESRQLTDIVKWRKKTKPDRAKRLGDVLSELMENEISPRQARFGRIAQLWSRLLPVELDRHCKLDHISRGQLKVLVDSPSHLHELRLCSSELLGQLQQHCPAAHIKEIKFAIG